MREFLQRFQAFYEEVSGTQRLQIKQNSEKQISNYFADFFSILHFCNIIDQIEKYDIEFINQFSDHDNEKVLVYLVVISGLVQEDALRNLPLIFKNQFKMLFDDKFDYVLILDSEGLQNPNQNDPEFDKKIALFVLAISDIILINVKVQKSSGNVYFYTRIDEKFNFSSQTIKLVFNQNNDCKNFAPLSFRFKKKESIKILGLASIELIWRTNQNTGIFEEWGQQVVNETFNIFGRSIWFWYLDDSSIFTKTYILIRLSTSHSILIYIKY